MIRHPTESQARTPTSQPRPLVTLKKMLRDTIRGKKKASVLRVATWGGIAQLGAMGENLEVGRFRLQIRQNFAGRTKRPDFPRKAWTASGGRDLASLEGVCTEAEEAPGRAAEDSEHRMSTKRGAQPENSQSKPASMIPKSLLKRT